MVNFIIFVATLQRANLYINQSEDALGGKDWNDVYPWNAPPGDPAIANNIPIEGTGKKAVPAWWDGDWGYNEWNRKWDGTGDHKLGFTGLAQLPAGDGKQVISLLPFSPVRTIGGSISEPNAANKLEATVAYSFPYHRSEPYTGDAGSQDSPFDYVKKMLVQSAQLKDMYNEAGIRFVKAKSTWPKPNATSASEFANFDSYVSNVQVLDVAVVNAWASTNTKKWYDYPKIKNFALASWAKGTLSPSDMWWRYNVSKPNNWSEASHSPAAKAFVPSLGLKIGSMYHILSTDAYDENFHPENGSITRESFVDQSYVIEAGTDCVGFAQRSASYSGRIYKWRALPSGWTETGSTHSGTDDIWVALKEYNEGTNGRLFVRTGDNAADVIAKNATDDANADYLEALRRVVPGDIWIKYSSVSVPQQSATTPSHIAIVAYVPSDPSITDSTTFMSQMILIEGEYTNKIQSVIKKLSVGDYNNNNVTVDKIIYSGFKLTPLTLLPDGLRCRSWAIRRLK